MTTTQTTTGRSSQTTLDLLNQALNVEYSLIVHYPRIANSLPDEETRRLVHGLGEASIRHADVVADAIKELGGKPDWSFEPFPEHMDTVSIFKIQLQKEKMALMLHQETARLVRSRVLREKFKAIAGEEESHIRTVEEILDRLASA
jgi:rubrerythrin